MLCSLRCVVVCCGGVYLVIGVSLVMFSLVYFVLSSVRCVCVIGCWSCRARLHCCACYAILCEGCGVGACHLLC